MKTEIKGCLKHCRVSSLTDETFICGATKLGGKPWLCDDCLRKIMTEEEKEYPVIDRYLTEEEKEEYNTH